MNAAWPERKSLTSGTVVVFLLALVKLLLHFYTNLFAGYGIFRDELYYIACSEHLRASSLPTLFTVTTACLTKTTCASTCAGT